jgi:hypothetical protein
LDRVKGSVSLSDRVTLEGRTHCTSWPESLVGLTAGLDAMEQRKISLHFSGTEPQLSSPYLVAIEFELYDILVHKCTLGKFSF